MKISTIIPVINEADNLSLAIARAWESGVDEVVIVDGGSTDGTPEIAEKENCLLVRSPAGRGLQLNSGAEVATGDILLFLHADNWLPLGSGQQIKDTMADCSRDYGCFRQRITNERWIYRAIEKGNDLRANWQRLIYGDQAMFIKKDLFHQLGGFPDIQIMEDFAFSLKLGKHGAPLILTGPTYVSSRRWENQACFVRQLGIGFFRRHSALERHRNGLLEDIDDTTNELKYDWIWNQSFF